MKKVSLFLLGGLFFSLAYANTLDEIKSSKTIRVGIRSSNPPFCQKDDNGNYEGFEIELSKALAKEIIGNDAKVEFSDLALNDRVSSLQQNKVDMVVAFFIKTKNREKLVSFSMPYLSGYVAAIARKNSDIHKVADLKNKKILYIDGFKDGGAHDFLSETGYGSERIGCSNNFDCFEKLQNGIGDVYINLNTSIAQLQLLDENYSLVLPSVGELDYICVGIAKDNKALETQINSAILKLSKSNFFLDAYKNIFEPFYKNTLDKKYLLLDDLYNTMF